MVGLAACSPSRFKWKEEVQLQNGEVLIVQRTVRFREYRPIGGGGGGSDTPESTLEVLSPLRPDNPPAWSQPSLLPMVFDRDPDTGEWFVVTTFYMCMTYRNLGRPRLPYAEFRYRDGQWVQRPLSEKLIGRQTNMLIPNQANVKTDHTLADKRGFVNDPVVSIRHRQIVSSWQTDC